MTYVILNHQLVKKRHAHISVEDRGFRFGDGLFETLRVKDGVPYRFEWHMDRLKSGLEAIRIEFQTDTLKSQCRQLLHANTLTEGLLRIQITRGSGSRGYLPYRANPTVLIETLPLPAEITSPQALWLSGYEKISAAALPVQYKLTQGMNSTLARMEADDHGCLDALMLNAGGHISEASSSSVFWLHDGRLYTPALACGGLNSSTRSAIIHLSPYPVEEVTVELAALSAADALCLGNVAWQMVAIDTLKPTGLQWKSAALASALNDVLRTDQQRYSAAHSAFWKMA